MSVMSNILAFPACAVPTYAVPVPAAAAHAAAPLRRPAVLIRAAVAGQALWRRERDLRRVLGSDSTPAPGRALLRLREDEERLNTARLDGAADYDMRRHVLLLVAILAETRRAAQPDVRPDSRPVSRLRGLG
ncbi:DUF6477 family protein [Paracoccus alkenifer]|uniref:Uncharacterized protein n=1 Tax=Paracoccus alkenifer TaxID=65735 RepID=A0A1H6LQV4_9RHOB|nr:DUF6477 family protein [Paracoccus alkenifer]SEH91052.1 hypothetical protein SAMN04488075_1774 [Paracoccus alkenifer]